MGRKRKLHEEDRIRKKIRKLEAKLVPRRTRIRVISSSSESEQENSHAAGVEWDSPSPSPYTSDITGAIPAQQEVPASPTAQSALIAATTAPAAEPSSQDLEETLNNDILQLLGEAPKIDTALGGAIYKDIATRWQNILQNGLQKEVKDKLFEEHLVPSNCNLLIAPALNPEVKAALPEMLIKRDFMLSQKLKQIGIALAALARAMDLLVTKDCNTQVVLKPLSDACRILCDSHYIETRTRRKFAISSVNTSLKDTLIGATRDCNLLFGEQLPEKLRAAKTVQKTGDCLKNTKPTTFNRNNNLNNKVFSKNRFLDINRKYTKSESVATRQAQRTARQQPSSSHQQPGASRLRLRDQSPPPPPLSTRRTHRR